MTKILFTPGPVQLHPRVLQALSGQAISHRSPEFRRLLEEVELKLGKIHKTENYVALLTGSGTLAVEAMIYSLLNPGEKLLIVSHGEFAQRAMSTALARGVNVSIIESDKPGEPVSAEKVKVMIDSERYDALLIVYNETSVGLAYRDLRELSLYAKKKGLLTLVDAVSALAGEPLEMDSWKIDAVASASQKAIAAPPGLSFVALSSEAVEKAGRTKNKPCYLDLQRYIKFYHERKETPYTPSVNLVYALSEALDIILEEGIDKWINKHIERAKILYRELEALGLSPLVPKKKYRSNTVAAFKTTTINMSASSIASKLYEKGIVIAKGIGELKEQVIRIGLMGHIRLSDIELLIESIKSIIREHKESKTSP